MWIYSGAGNAAGYFGTLLLDVQPAANGNTWLTKLRAKSRLNTYTGTAGNTGANNYPRWGWAWLFNRRVFYNNGEVAGDVADVFVQPGTVASLFTVNKTSTLLADWSLTYRKYKTFKDQPSVASGPHYVTGVLLSGRFPGHTEPTESPREDLVTTWGHNTSAGSALYWTGANPTVPGVVANFPLVLTSIRCVEHFQGGPTTRNNSWNVEAEPVPWIEINSFDARSAVPPINDGDWVQVETARGNSTSTQEAISPNSVVPVDVHDGHWARGFKARVGVGMDSNQRVGRGVVAIPWHWGDKGLSTGSRANDLCIDAWDANTTIPEYKACLCKISKIV
jgi:formate dehydrogenase major subunit